MALKNPTVEALVQAIKERQAPIKASSQEIGIQIIYPDDPGFEAAIYHYIPNDIPESVDVVLEPGSEFEMGVLMGLISEKKFSEIPFAMKGAGHFTNPKYSGRGILINMGRFNLREYDQQNKTVNVGAGLTWGMVYDYLNIMQKTVPAQRELGVVGGDPHVGITGYLSGGGFSLLTSRFGLGIDNIVGIQVILPGSGELRNVSSTEDPELFKALKGGAHNFGVITRFTLRVHEYAKRNDPIYQDTYDYSDRKMAKDILEAFIESNPTRESVMVVGFRYDLKDGNLTCSIPVTEWFTDDFWAVLDASRRAHRGEKENLARFLFSGGGSHVSNFHESVPLAKAYEAFALRHLPVTLDKLQDDSHFTQLDTPLEIDGKTFVAGDLIERKLLLSIQNGNRIDWNSTTVHQAGYKAVLIERDPNLRGRLTSISVAHITRELIDEVDIQTEVLSLSMKKHNGIRVSFDMCQLHKDAFNGVKRADSAWPHEEGKVFGPLVGEFEWSGEENDQFWLKAIDNAQNALQIVASKIPENRNLPKYLNEALENVSVEDIYQDHLQPLKALRQKYDPNNVMGRAKGFIIKA